MSTDIAEDPRKGLPSASGIEQLYLCPASWRAQRGAPELESEDARIGTELHKHMEMGTIPEDPEQAEAVEWCRAKEAELIEGFHGEQQELIYVREKRIWFRDDNNKPLFSGQADLVVLGGNKITIIDYKFGRGEVTDAGNNLQLWALAMIEAQQGLNLMGSFAVPLDIQAVILQPYVTRKPVVMRKRIDSTPFYHEEEKKLLDLLEAAMAEDAPYRPNVKACKYCRAISTCPAVNKQLVAAAKVEDLPAMWQSFTPAKKAQALELAKVAKKFAASVEAQASKDLHNGLPIEGWEMGAGRTSFTITDANQAFSLLNASAGITAASFVQCCSVKISELDKAYHQARVDQLGKVTLKSSKDALRELLADCAEQKTTAGTIKRSK